MAKTVFNKYVYLVLLIGFVILTLIADICGAECNCPPIKPRQGVALTSKNSKGVKIDSSAPSPYRTTIDYKCQPFYRPLRGSIVLRQLQCRQDCTWQNMRRLEEFICEIDCGKPSQPHVPFIAMGQKTLRYSWPWHATIFVKDENTMENHYICGGTLISEHVLTAAHCLITLKMYSLESYQVVLGAISSNWTENIEDARAQFFRINKSYVPDESIVLSEPVSPVCFPYDGDFAKPQEPVVAGEGEVVGYGKNEHGEYETYLKYTRLPVLGAGKCYEILEKRQGIEQFCAGVVNGSAVCNGDSGGGMVFKGQGMSRYYVQGIVSHGLLTRGKVTCDGLSYFSNVLYFTKWVAEIVDRIEEKNQRMSGETSTPNSVIPTHDSTTAPAVQANDYVGKDGECTENLMEDGVDIICTHRGVPTTCVNAPNGTIATYACKYGYQSEVASTTRRMCRNGIWTTRRQKWQCMLQCGIGGNEYSLFINGSVESKISKWPWNVGLYQQNPPGSGKYEQFCGGTLISSRGILTAAHCVTQRLTTTKRSPEEIVLYFGKYFRSADNNDDKVQIRKVERIHVHDYYDSVRLGSDIAFLLLDKKVEITVYVLPVCLPTKNDLETGDVGTLAGWGMNTEIGYPEALQEARIPVVSIRTCSQSHPSLEALVKSDSFCAGYRNGTSACDGDSGGGLVFKDTSGKWELHGIVSAAIATRSGGCDPRFYTVLTRVINFRDWIDRILDMYEPK